jgi:glycosyltransferase involved in cell wall biosynthesis
MRILMLMPDLAVRGPIAGHSLPLAQAMRRQGADVGIGRWGRRYDAEPLFSRLLGRIADVPRVRRALVAHDVDVLLVKTHTDAIALARDVALMACTRGLRARRVVQFHGSRAEELAKPGRSLSKAAARFIVRGSDAVLLLSRSEREVWRVLEPRGRYHVVANAYVHKPAYDLPPEPVDEGAAPPVVLFVGRFVAGKGAHDLVEAFSRVCEAVPCRLVMAGDGPQRASLRRLVAERGLEDLVSFPGYLTGDALTAAYRSACVFALPSYSEGFATVLSEAMDAGLPLVTTGICGALDHLSEGENVLFVEPGRVDQLAAALERLLGDGALRRHKGARNRLKVREFAPDVLAREYVRICEETGAVMEKGGAR